MNHWAAIGEKSDEERCGQFCELSGQGGQCCFELFAVCLKDTEDSQTGKNGSSRGIKEQRQRETRLMWKLRTEDDGWNNYDGANTFVKPNNVADEVARVC